MIRERTVELPEGITIRTDKNYSQSYGIIFTLRFSISVSAVASPAARQGLK